MKYFNKTALVLGGSGEIGGAVAKRLAKEGFTVGVHYYRNKKVALRISKEILKAGGKSFIIPADICRQSDIEHMYADVRKRCVAVDVFINCIGLNNSDEGLSGTSFAKFKKIVDINLCGSAAAVKKFLPLIKKSKSGRIIFVSSILAFIGSARRPAYAAAKGGIASLAKSLALDLAPEILVNTVVPAYIDTKMVKRSKTETLGKRLTRIPLKRLGTVDEVAGLISFLCSEDARYIHGQNIHINGGVYFG